MILEALVAHRLGLVRVGIMRRHPYIKGCAPSLTSGYR